MTNKRIHDKIRSQLNYLNYIFFKIIITMKTIHDIEGQRKMFGIVNRK